MTLVLNLRLNNAIVMSADKRATVYADNEGTQIKQYLDYTQKLFEWNGIGISFYGDTATELVGAFLEQCGDSQCTLSEFVDAFFEFIIRYWSPRDTGFYICGSECGELQMWRIRSKKKIKEQLPGNILSTDSGGDDDAVDTYHRLIGGGQVIGDTGLDLEHARYPYSYSNVDEAADFCRFVTKTAHLSMMFFGKGAVTVGPHAEVLVITTRGARWHNSSIHHL